MKVTTVLCDQLPFPIAGSVRQDNDKLVVLTSDAVAAIMSDILLKPISHDGSKETFLREFSGIWERPSRRQCPTGAVLTSPSRNDGVGGLR